LTAVKIHVVLWVMTRYSVQSSDIKIKHYSLIVPIITSLVHGGIDFTL